MPPLPPNQTKRLFIDYEVNGQRHTFLWRYRAATPDSTAIFGVTQFLNAIRPALHNDVVFDGARISDLGSDVSFPTAWQPISGTGSGGTPDNFQPQFVSFVGRSRDGRRARISIYGVVGLVDGNYRYDASEFPDLGAALAVLQSLAEPPVSASGLAVVWNNYINAGFNAYFQRRQRRNG